MKAQIISIEKKSSKPLLREVSKTISPIAQRSGELFVQT